MSSKYFSYGFIVFLPIIGALGYIWGFNVGKGVGMSEKLIQVNPHSIRYRIKKEEQPESSDVVSRSSKSDTGSYSPVSLESGWYSQISAVQNLDDARRLVVKYEALSFEAKIDLMKAGGKDYFRIVVGPYKSQKLAEKASVKIFEKTKGKKRPFVTFVK